VNLRLSVAPQVNTRRSGSAEGKGRSPLGRRTAAAVANEGTAIVQVEQRESHTPGGAGGGRWGGDHGRGRAVEGKEERNPMKEEGAGREGGGGLLETVSPRSAWSILGFFSSWREVFYLNFIERYNVLSRQERPVETRAS
jgi:hypothetical protein